MKDTFRNISTEKQKLIIQAAMLEFGTYGYEAASTNRLVKTLGISKGSLFKYFENKLDLYKTLLNIAIDELLAHMNTYRNTSTKPKERLVDYALLEYDFLIERPNMYKFFYSMQKEFNHPELEEVKNDLMSRSLILNEKIYSQVGIKNDPFFRQHLLLIITGYNRAFMAVVPNDVEWSDLKQQYMNGLRKHLDLIRWED